MVDALRMRRFFLAAAFLLAVVAVVWRFAPGSAVDRAVFRWGLSVTSAAEMKDAKISGAGTHAEPWRIVRHAEAEISPAGHSVIALMDDLGAVFQSRPPAPLDFAVILKNFRRLGGKSAALAAPLAWESADPLGLGALEKTLAEFPEIITTTPLARAPVSDVMPAPFRRASVPIEGKSGDFSLVPVVNHIPLSGVILGGENALAGFQYLDADRSPEIPTAIARWDGRIVFSLPVILAARKLGIGISEIIVRPGKELRFGKSGVAVDLDVFGRVPRPEPGRTRDRLMTAEAAINAPATAGGDFPWLVLRDDRSGGNPAARSFSESLDPLVTQLATGRLPEIIRRLPVAEEILLLAAAAMVVAFFGTRGKLGTHGKLVRLAGMTAFICVCAWGFSAAMKREIWPPVLPVLALLIGEYGIAKSRQRKFSDAVAE